MARISNRSSVVVPAAVIGTAAVSFALWINLRIGDVETKAVRSIDDRAMLNRSVEQIQTKLDAIPRIEEDVSWIRAELARRAGATTGTSDQAKR